MLASAQGRHGELSEAGINAQVQAPLVSWSFKPDERFWSLL